MLTAASLLASYAALEPAARPQKRRRSPVGEPVVVRTTQRYHRVRYARSRVQPTRRPLWVETICRRPQFIERIDLLRPDADQRLARYALAADRF